MKTHLRLIFAATCAMSMLAACAQPKPAVLREAGAPVASAAPVTTTPRFEPAPCPFKLSDAQADGRDIVCGYVSVPADHADPNGRVFELAVAVFKSRSANRPADPVMLLSGGPGEKTVYNAAAVAAQMKTLYGDRDFIVFDQRGVGLSRPALECPEYSQAFIDMLDDPDADAGAKTMFDAAMQCRDRLIQEGHTLSAFNTTQNAADVEAIRVALGYETLNLMGASYGSLLAQEVMRAYPQFTRSVAMNSVMPRDKSVFLDSALATAQAAERLMATCDADVACAAAYPDLRDTLFATIDRLNADPVYITVTSMLDGQPYLTALTGDTLFGNLTIFMYLTQLIPALPRVITDVANGDYALISQLQGVVFLLMDGLSRGMQYSVLCAEDLIGRDAEEYLARRSQLPPQLTGRTSPDALRQYGVFAICQNWPVTPAAASIKQPVRGDIPALLIVGALDPVTPPEFGRRVAEGLTHSYVYELPGVGHDVIVSSDCARQIIRRFFDAPDRAPDASCAAEAKGPIFDAPAADQSITLKPAWVGDPVFAETLVPESWSEPSPGVFTRSRTGADQVALVVAFAPNTRMDAFLGTFAASLGVDAPEAAETRAAGERVWSVYKMATKGVGLALGLASDGTGVLALALQAPEAEFDSLYEQVFMPALEGTRPAR